MCDICGNDIDQGIRICPFCGGKQEAQAGIIPAGAAFHKVVNLEMGRPLVESALRKLERELHAGRLQGLRILTVIHGYGSSGKGGAIGIECRKVLAYLKGKGEINTFILGEEFKLRSGPTQDLLRRFPQIAGNANLNMGNRGITLVVL
ncbi:MAG: Smr/MutS family protein [Desulfobulbaceae bacterium]